MKPSTLRIGYRYRPNRLAESYDAIVIGSGMSGLTTAALLTEFGKRVCVLEQHYTAGGYTHSFERGGYEWDVGVHYIGDVGAKTRTRKLFDFLSDGKLHWSPMDAEYDRFFLGEKAFSAKAGKREFRDNLVAQFPREEQAIDRYMALLAEAGGAMSAFGLNKIAKPWQRVIARPFTRLPDTMFRKTYDVLAELTDDQDLIAVLCGQWGDMGLPPRRSAFLMHAMIARHYLYGGYYPVGGSWKIAETIIPKIQRTGGEVFTYARVAEILLEGDSVRGVAMQDGTVVGCDCVVSSAGVDNTFNRLLPGDAAERFGYREKLDGVAPSMGHLGVYIGIRGTAAELRLPKCNYWIYPSSDFDRHVDEFVADVEAPFPVVYISFPSAKDPDYLNRHPGTSTIEIVAPAPYGAFERWRGTTWGKRGAEYEALKDRLTERLLRHLYDKLPHLEGKLDHVEMSTPLSTEWFGSYDRGELYGLEHSPERLRQDWLAPATKIDGLWLTGQDTLTCGVTGAMMSGMLTATAMVGPRKMGPLMQRIYR